MLTTYIYIIISGWIYKYVSQFVDMGPQSLSDRSTSDLAMGDEDLSSYGNERALQIMPASSVLACASHISLMIFICLAPWGL